MGTCWVLSPRHTAKIDEIMGVVCSDFDGATLFGDAEEIAGPPYKRCRLAIVALEVSLVLPGQFLRYTGSFCCLDRAATVFGISHPAGIAQPGAGIGEAAQPRAEW